MISGKCVLSVDCGTHKFGHLPFDSGVEAVIGRCDAAVNEDKEHRQGNCRNHVVTPSGGKAQLSGKVFPLLLCQKHHRVCTVAAWGSPRLIQSCKVVASPFKANIELRLTSSPGAR